ncbi:hypothetical protein MBAV_003101 [Candidatus Magnetobacterium bavaricum]|uniref:Uncharacterized protein n=1 Tax=Candidatus Magnetobacterium bavaricum TaxID=29290 RepID=A0A0F3GRW7_9BACT|nr:hypothetical protein MBAV_003101 [Candidatus Magnetobacterium bavaricum]
MCRLHREGQLGADLVKLRPPGDQLHNALWPLIDKHSHGLFIAEAIAGLYRVVKVDAYCVFVAEGNGYSPLGILGGGLPDLILGDDADAAAGSKPYRRTKPRHPAAYYKVIHLYNPHILPGTVY